LKSQKPGGYWEASSDLYRPKYTATNWMLLVLSEMGMTAENPRVELGASLLFQRWLKEVTPPDEGEICFVGNLARMLTRFGYGSDPRVKPLFNWIARAQKEDGGWHCFRSTTGTLDCWEGLAAFDALPRSMWTRSMKNSAERGAEFYLERHLLKEGARYLPWYRLHYPNHYYYDVLVGLDLLTSLGYGGDRRLSDALGILRRKRGSDGRWRLEKVHPDPSGYSWGKHNLKRKIKPFAIEKEDEPSRWLTLKAMRVLNRVETAT
jgi:hypothetical protein